MAGRNFFLLYRTQWAACLNHAPERATRFRLAITDFIVRDYLSEAVPLDSSPPPIAFGSERIASFPLPLFFCSAVRPLFPTTDFTVRLRTGLVWLKTSFWRPAFPPSYDLTCADMQGRTKETFAKKGGHIKKD